MIYSCFNAESGLYRYFEDGKTHPINADLPVPTFPRQTERIGVPSIEAARPFPSGAKPAGQGWHARGRVVQCPGRASLGASFEVDSKAFIAGVVVAGIALAFYWKGKRK